MASALRRNRSLTELDLRENSIGPRGTKAIADALADNETMRTLYLQVRLLLVGRIPRGVPRAPESAWSTWVRIPPIGEKKVIAWKYGRTHRPHGGGQGDVHGGNPGFKRSRWIDPLHRVSPCGLYASRRGMDGSKFSPFVSRDSGQMGSGGFLPMMSSLERFCSFR